MKKKLLAAILMVASMQFGSIAAELTVDPQQNLPEWRGYTTDFEDSFLNENNKIKFSKKLKFKRTIYVDLANGNDSNRGTTPSSAIRTIDALAKLNLKPGDQILLKGGQTHRGTIELVDLNSLGNAPIHIGSYGDSKAIIDFAGYSTGITIQNTSNVIVSDIKLTANGGPASTSYMYREGDRGKLYRYAIFVNSVSSKIEDITIYNVDMHDIYYYNDGDKNIPTDVRPCRMWSTNGESGYGWGVKALARSKDGGIDGLTIKECNVEDVSHTGYKINGAWNSLITNFLLEDCSVIEAGGPGSQFSGCKDAVMRHCKTVNSGSRDDSRKWGRGSGMWIHSSDNFLFERNLFEGAQGIADCCGGHIDIGCDNVVMQYNLSRNNAGGFVEILGRGHNNSYRYNISINDGWRNPSDMEQDDFWMWEQKAVDKNGNDMRKIIGKYGALITVNGHTGNQFTGPYQSYIYNNTIVCHPSRKDGFTNAFVFEVATSTKGVLVMNNLFWVPGQMMRSGSARFLSKGKMIDNSYDLRKATGELDENGDAIVRDMTAQELEDMDLVIKNNLYQLYDPKFAYGENVLPTNSDAPDCKNSYRDMNPMGGDPGFRKNANWHLAEDLIPSNGEVINRGKEVKKLKSDKTEYGVLPQLQMSYDFFGNPITTPIIGACVVK